MNNAYRVQRGQSQDFLNGKRFAPGTKWHNATIIQTFISLDCDGDTKPMEPGLYIIQSTTTDGYAMLKPIDSDDVIILTEVCLHDMLMHGRAVNIIACTEWLKTYNGNSEVDEAAKRLLQVMWRDKIGEVLKCETTSPKSS